MKEITGNIWDYQGKDSWIVIPTNGFVKDNGRCVMGRGLALQASNRYPSLPGWLGLQIAAHGNTVSIFRMERLVTFPVKHNWWEKADILLITQSCKQLLELSLQGKIYMPRVGCGNGGLGWNYVRPTVEYFLSKEDITIVNIGG